MSTPGEPKKARGRPPLGLVPEPVTEGFPGHVSFVKSAAAMRDAPSSTLAEVAFNTGYSEMSTFFRAFRRWTGQTPREYQSSQRSNP